MARSSKPRFILTLFIILVSLAVIGGLVLVDYRAAVALVAGGIVALVVLGLLRMIRNNPRRIWPVIVVVIIFVAGAVGGAVLLLGPLSGSADGGSFEPAEEQSVDDFPDEPMAEEEEPAPQPPVAVVTSYHMIIQPDSQAQSFSVVEEVVYDIYQSGQLLSADIVQVVNESTVEASVQGFLTWGLEVEPLGGGARSTIVLVAPDGAAYQSRVCSGSGCPPVTIELRDFPNNAFVAARDVTEVERLPFVNTETIIWNPRDLFRPVAFAYIRPPFNSLRGVISPLLGASSVSDWFIGVVGMLGTIAVAPIIRSFIEEWFEGKLVAGAKGVANRGRRRSKRQKSEKKN